MSLFLEPEIAKQYECTICFEIYKEPVQLGCEEHLFCNQCIKTLISENGRSFHCPLCRKKCHSKSVTRVKFIDRQINELKIQCPNAINVPVENTNNKQSISTLRRSTRLKAKKENNECPGRKRKRYDDGIHQNKKRKLNDDPSNGCEWKGCYSELAKHRTTCPLQTVRCKFCALSLLQHKLKEHHVECPWVPIACVQCGTSGIRRRRMVSHIALRCPMTRIRCTECKEQIQRKNKKLHDKNE
eukprot:440904_1